MKYDRRFVPFFVHRLVAWEWVLKNRNISLTVNHIDGVKSNNYYMNLEWVTQLENIRHAIKIGLITEQNGIHTNHKLTEEEVHMICKMLEDPNIKYDDIINKLDNKVNIATIANISRGFTWNHISKNYNIQPRTYTGEASPNHKLTEEDVCQICSLLQNPNNTYEQIYQMVQSNHRTCSRSSC